WILDNKNEARLAVLGLNVGLSCIKSGVGSYMNDKGFFEGCTKGAFAGLITYLGEYIAIYNNIPMIGGFGKLVHDLGVSMSDNVMRGESILSQYQTEFGPVTLTFRDSIIPRPSFTITPMVAMIGNFIKGQEFDFEKSLYNLTPVFKNNSLDIIEFNGEQGIVEGYTTGNVISYTPGSIKGYTSDKALAFDRLVISHEFNHTLFWSKLRFSGDLLHWVPTEKVLGVPKMEEIMKSWNMGQELAYCMFASFGLSMSTYYYNPMELEAYSMQRSINLISNR
ncbi:MAG: hypothetical protein V1914_02920, partial [archaeon]